MRIVIIIITIIITITINSPTHTTHTYYMNVLVPILPKVKYSLNIAVLNATIMQMLYCINRSLTFIHNSTAIKPMDELSK